MSVKYPKVKSDNKQRFYVVFYSNGKRYRLFNGSKINSNLYPNSYPLNKRYEIAQLLAAEVFKYISSGLSIQEPVRAICKSDKEYLKLALDNIQKLRLLDIALKHSLPKLSIEQHITEEAPKEIQITFVDSNGNEKVNRKSLDSFEFRDLAG